MSYPSLGSGTLPGPGNSPSGHCPQEKSPTVPTQPKRPLLIWPCCWESPPSSSHNPPAAFSWAQQKEPAPGMLCAQHLPWPTPTHALGPSFGGHSFLGLPLRPCQPRMSSSTALLFSLFPIKPSSQPRAGRECLKNEGRNK